MLHRWLCLGLCFVAASLNVVPLDVAVLRADDPPASDPKDAETASTGEQVSDPEQKPFVLDDQVRDAVSPLFATLAKAKVSRATVEMVAESKMKDEVLERHASTYQIASSDADQFTIYLKEPEQQTRVYCDGTSLLVALEADAYLKLPEPISNQQAVTSLPFPLGPYPEPVLALAMAGVDPAISFVAGMKSITISDREPFAADTPAVHLRGVQADEVTWELWIATGDQPRPLRLLVDLTPMLVASNQVQIPEGYAYQLRYDFLSWRVTGDLDESLFSYTPSPDAKEYRSFDEYYESLAGVMAEHPLLGKESPAFEGTLLGQDKISSDSFAGKVVVIDFWATWCAPCVASLPTIKQVTDQYADKGVLFFALNTGEQADEVQTFLKERELELKVILDPDGKIATAFRADAIPQTILIGKDGIIESAHIGFVGEEALKQRLIDELDVLTIGGRIASAEAASESVESSDDSSESKVDQP